MSEQTYRGNGKHDWERVTPGNSVSVEPIYRLRVPGGWLYSEDGSPAMTFVPMPEVVKHEV